VRFDLRRSLDRIADLRGYQLKAAKIELCYTRPAEALWVDGDADQLLQVFFNLVLNAEQAIVASRASGEIRLDGGREKSRVWATVRDNGSGIPADRLERVFDPFFTTKPAGQGSGLGLSISHGIVQQHGGTVEIESEEGAGTLVRVSIPAARAPVTAAVPAPRTGSARPRRALVIDDEASICALVEQFLKNRAWTVVALQDSNGVESACQNSEFDLVVCDLKMPGRDGIEVLEVLRRERPELAKRFLLMTGNLADAEMKGMQQLDGIAVVRKPFTLARLAEAIANIAGDPAEERR
jgi:CheY-like chemotaxis protein